jgi:ribosomal protein S18 acetylase RimI-like enzyme
MRRQGVGRKLLETMIDIIREEQHHSEVGLFVYRDNAPAYQCYLALGFEVQEYPDDAPLRDVCYYLTKTILSPPGN